MVKTFKRIAALAMAIALVVCFAVSASAAVTVTTTTQYAGTQDNVNVTVNVEGATGADYITYYATNGSTPVYIDQSAATSGAATFKFQTAATNLNSAVKVGYTGAQSAEDADVTANTVKYGDATLATLPTEQPTANVTISEYPLTAGNEVKAVTATNATVDTFAYANGDISVTLSAIKGDVVLTVEEEAAEADTSVATMLDAAGLTVDSTRKFTVLGAATGSEEFGVIITKDTIETKTYSEADFAEAFTANEEKFEAITSGQNGVFAVQIIDEATDDAEMLIKAGETYNVAVYAKTSNGTGYKVVVKAEAVTVK